MSPLQRNWEQFRFNQNETQNWDLTENINDEDENNEENLALLLDDSQDAVSRFMNKKSRRSERHESKKSRPVWQ